MKHSGPVNYRDRIWLKWHGSVPRAIAEKYLLAEGYQHEGK
jgi:hypothetical protein